MHVWVGSSGYIRLYYACPTPFLESQVIELHVQWLALPEEVPRRPHALALICPFIMNQMNDQMALAIAKTWLLHWCLCG